MATNKTQDLDSDLAYAIALSLGEVQEATTDNKIDVSDGKSRSSDGKSRSLDEELAWKLHNELNNSGLDNGVIDLTGDSSDVVEDGAVKSSQGNPNMKPVDNHFRFKDGYIGLTSVKPTSQHHVSIRDVVHVPTLQKALVSTFEYEEAFFEPIVPRKILLDILLHDHSQNPSGSTNKRRDREGNLIVPPRPSNPGLFGCFHAKLFVLEYEDSSRRGQSLSGMTFSGKFLRVAVSSANLIEADWGHVDNHVFIQDFPLREDGNGASCSSSTTECASNSKTSNSKECTSEFQAYLVFYLRRCKVPEYWIETILNHDMTDAKGRLVGSMPIGLNGERRHSSGNYNFDSSAQTGLLRLANVVRDLRESNEEVVYNGDFLPLDTQSSSVGKLTMNWIDKFQWFASGMVDEPPKPKKPVTKRPATSNSSSSSTKKSKLSQKQENGPADNEDSDQTETDEEEPKAEFKLYFPTTTYVLKAVAMGLPGWNQILFAQDPDKFPSQVLRRYIAPNGKLSHTKVVLSDRSNEGDKTGYIYIGSANMSPSAWGNVTERPGSRVFCMARNYEFGLVFPVTNGQIVLGEQKLPLTDVLPFKRHTGKGKEKDSFLYSSTDSPFLRSDMNAFGLSMALGLGL